MTPRMRKRFNQRDRQNPTSGCEFSPDIAKYVLANQSICSYYIRKENNIMETFGQRFQRLRKAKNLTQEDIASKIGITAQSVSKWENDLSAPDINILLELADILGVSVEELLGRESHKVTIVKNNFDDRKAILRIVVDDSDGDNVRINFPIALGEALIGKVCQSAIEDKEILDQIHFAQIFELIRNGTVGQILEVHSADGDHVTIFVDYQDEDKAD